VICLGDFEKGRDQAKKVLLALLNAQQVASLRRGEWPVISRSSSSV